MPMCDVWHVENNEIQNEDEEAMGISEHPVPYISARVCSVVSIWFQLIQTVE